MANGNGAIHPDIWNETTQYLGSRATGAAPNAQSFNADRLSGGSSPQLSYYRNRAYDQKSGRWTQEDPIGIAGGLNLYQFNGNDPVGYSDPFGLCPPKDISEVFMCTGQMLQPAERALQAYALRQ